jgi:putative FmdB family regulatory protein
VPTYEYRCPEGHEFDHFFRTISAAKAELECPTCGKLAERRMSGGSALLFKGSGFYITDYGKDGKKDQRPATPKPEGKGESGGGTGSGSESGSGSGSADTSSKKKSGDSTGSTGSGKDG